ncbi:MAG TPA: hypothetical protein VHY35_01320 [Stellaceae bacterium]|jgi:hypothetical protein|nr:hypothetical protein [Stellaceae bacterium]
MPIEGSVNNDATEKSYAERTFPNPSDMLGLMVSIQRLHQQLLWQMGEVMADMMAMPMGRDRSDVRKPDPIKRAVTNLADAVDSATESLQQGGKPR